MKKDQVLQYGQESQQCGFKAAKNVVKSFIWIKLWIWQGHKWQS